MSKIQHKTNRNAKTLLKHDEEVEGLLFEAWLSLLWMLRGCVKYCGWSLLECSLNLVLEFSLFTLFLRYSIKLSILNDFFFQSIFLFVFDSSPLNRLVITGEEILAVGGCLGQKAEVFKN